MLTAEPCEVCGTSDGVQAHHDDYSKPLAVRWLCRSHHMKLHVQLKKEGRVIAGTAKQKTRAHSLVHRYMTLNVPHTLQRRLNLSDREYRAIEASARANDRTTSAEIRRAIREYLDRQAEAK